MKKRKVDFHYSESNFSNPFSEGTFMYDGEIYECDPHDQVLLYLYIYGLTPKGLWKLIKTHMQKSPEYIELPKIYLFKTLSRLARTGGCIRSNEYCEMLDDLCDRATKEGILVERDDFTALEFRKRGKEVFEPWVQYYILEKYSHISKYLRNKYPKVKIFI